MLHKWLMYRNETSIEIEVKHLEAIILFWYLGEFQACNDWTLLIE